MANTISTRSKRDVYRSKTLAKALRKMLVAEKVCQVDNSDLNSIQSPYGSQPTTTVQALTGTYSPADFTITDDALTVNNEFIVSEHIFDFQKVLNSFDLFASRFDEMTYSVATAIDRFVINNLCEDGTGTYTTPTGGFTNAANVNTIMSDLLGKVAGYSETFNGLFLIVESTDVPGLIRAGATSGFSFADAALNNGFMDSYMGVDIYVVRSVFADETLGTTTYTNSGHRVFGVKNMATYASPRSIQQDEKSVSGKTGKELVVWGYVGFKLWAPKTDLVVDITLA
mgnify:FL=1